MATAIINYRGYTLCEGHPGSRTKYGAFRNGCWFESEDYDQLKLIIDEALDEE